MSAGVVIPARPASAVVLARPAASGGFAVFMVRRHVKSDFVPDAYVFPGGSVKTGDRATETVSGLCGHGITGPTALGTGFRAAAIRECFEEAGVLLARRDGVPLDISHSDVGRFAAYRDALYRHEMSLEEIAARERLVLAADDLVHWAHWITPETFPKRFDTHFFLATMPDGQEPAHDQIETTDGIWIQPREALDRYERGEFPIVFATIHQLRALCEVTDLMAVRTLFAETPRTIMPRVVQRSGRDVILLPDEE
jgi:8-oxo-dGTP pyrophosphatase MutT (NUDIX family)